MADEADGGGGIVKVTTSELRTSAGYFDDWGQQLLDSLFGLEGFEILPGNFPAAEDLKKTVDDRTLQLTTNVTNLGGALKEIGSKLLIIADDYDKAEDDNVGDAERIDPLYDGVNNILNTPPEENK